MAVNTSMQSVYNSALKDCFRVSEISVKKLPYQLLKSILTFTLVDIRNSCQFVKLGKHRHKFAREHVITSLVCVQCEVRML